MAHSLLAARPGLLGVGDLRGRGEGRDKALVVHVTLVL